MGGLRLGLTSPGGVQTHAAAASQPAAGAQSEANGTAAGTLDAVIVKFIMPEFVTHMGQQLVSLTPTFDSCTTSCLGSQLFWPFSGYDLQTQWHLGGCSRT